MIFLKFILARKPFDSLNFPKNSEQISENFNLTRSLAAISDVSKPPNLASLSRELGVKVVQNTGLKLCSTWKEAA